MVVNPKDANVLKNDAKRVQHEQIKSVNLL